MNQDSRDDEWHAFTYGSCAFTLMLISALGLASMLHTNGPLAMLVAFPYAIYIAWRAAEDVYRMTLTLKGYN